jgi:proteasome lid subunit RPN8/RPN11
MWTPTIEPTVCQTLWNLAIIQAPAESCGYLVSDALISENVTIVLTPNLAADPTKEFWLHPDEFKEYRSRYVKLALWHSHPYGRWDLSRDDKMLMVETQVPMVVVAWQPWPSVVWYELEAGQIRQVQSYRVEGVTV